MYAYALLLTAALMGFVALNWMTMGQILSVPMAAAGVWLLIRSAYWKNDRCLPGYKDKHPDRL